MVRCQDNSIYTGITKDIERRLKEHMEQTEKCAKYTLSHQVIKLEAVWQTENRTDAAKLEYAIKRLTKTQKEELIANTVQVQELLKDKIVAENYRRIHVICQKN